MEKVTIKSYAVKHKLSIFNVMKMVKSGKLNSVVTEEEGKEITYIILNDETEKEVTEQIVPIESGVETTPEALAKELSSLKQEVKLLKEEMTALKNSLEPRI